MDPTALAKLLELGPYGLAAAAIVFAGWALRGWQACTTARLADRDAYSATLITMAEKSTTALHASASTLAERTAAVKDLAASHLEQATAIRAMTAANDVHVDRVFDRLDGIGKLMERVSTALERRP